VSVAFYMDEHVPGAITRAARGRGIDVLTVQEDQRDQAADPVVLDRALALGRVVVTNDSDFKVEAARRQPAGEHFGGVIYVNLRKMTVGQCVAVLELFCFAGAPSDFADRVEHLPL